MKLNARPVNVVSRLSMTPFSHFSHLPRERRLRADTGARRHEIVAYLDRDKMDKILTNVLSNAFKFTPEGAAWR